MIALLAPWILAAVLWLVPSVFIACCLRGAGVFRHEPVFWSVLVVLWPLCLVFIGVVGLVDRRAEL